MRQRGRLAIHGVLAAVVLLGATCGSDEGSGASVEGFRRWIAEHRDNVGLVAVKPVAKADAIVLNGDVRFPLASTRKVLILGTYALRVADGALDPAARVQLADVERWYWAGTDGGAHPQALEAMKGRVRDGTVSLDDVVWAMIRWSDNAAADYVLQRVGGPAPVAAFARRSGMRRQDVLMPILGEYVAWSTDAAASWERLGPAGRSKRGAELARTTTTAGLATLDPPSIAEQRAFASSSTAGTPREWARLMEMLHAPGAFPSETAAIVRRHLGWPLEAFAANREHFSVFGAKGGSLAGMLTEAVFVQPKGKEAVAAVLFIRDLPSDVEAELRESFVHQQFLVKLAEDEAFWKETSNLLS